ncbi:MAG: hypothetical protein CVV02_12460 [Firmicutes bacterium HGW-Firmicutes-7]|nr:MAG: hypothetical protein CVV02_12460 [Firmicutes bacterium HGW-Firmicutes-7]
MSGHNERTGRKDVMEAYYKLIGEAHIENVIDELEAKRDEIDKVMVPESLDNWFQIYKKKKERDNLRHKQMNMMKKLSSRVAVFVLILIASMTVATLSVEAFRVQVLNFLLERKDSYTEVKVKEDVGSQTVLNLEVDSYYYPTYLPKGYYYENYSVTGNSLESIVIHYTNGTEVITFDQVKNGADYQLDTEVATISEIAIGDGSGQLIRKENQTILFWYNNENSFFIKGNLPANEFIRMAESLERNN